MAKRFTLNNLEFEVENNYNFEEPNNGIVEGIAIDVWKDANEEGEVAATVVYTEHGDIAVVWHNHGLRLNEAVLEAINDAKERLKANHTEKGVGTNSEYLSFVLGYDLLNSELAGMPCDTAKEVCDKVIADFYKSDDARNYKHSEYECLQAFVDKNINEIKKLVSAETTPTPKVWVVTKLITDNYGGNPGVEPYIFWSEKEALEWAQADYAITTAECEDELDVDNNVEFSPNDIKATLLDSCPVYIDTYTAYIEYDLYVK